MCMYIYSFFMLFLIQKNNYALKSLDESGRTIYYINGQSFLAAITQVTKKTKNIIIFKRGVLYGKW